MKQPKSVTTDLQSWLVAQNELLELLAADADADAVFHKLISSVEAIIPDTRCTVMLLDSNKQRLSSIYHSNTLAQIYLDTIIDLQIGVGQGSCGTAAYTGERVVVEDINTHNYWEKYREVAAQANIRACWSQPVFSPSQVLLGTFGLYYEEVRVPDEVELLLIESAARLAGIALEQNYRSNDLSSAQSRYLDLVSNVPVCIHEISMNGRFISMNAAGLAMLGKVQESEVLGKNYFEITEPTKPKDLETFFSSARSGNTVTFEYTNRADKTINASFIPVKSSDGRIQSVIGICEDITLRKNAERELQQNQQDLERLVMNRTISLEKANHELQTLSANLSSLMDAAPDAVFVLTDQGKINRVNQQAERLLGFSKNEMLGQSVEMLIPQRFRNVHISHRNSFTNNPSRREMGSGLDLFALHKDGQEIPIDVNLSPITVAGKALVAVSVRDVTEYKQQQQTLQQLKEQAESATEAKSRFLAAASHDLRQPLQSLGLYLSVLERRLEHELVQEIGGKMRRSLDVMTDLLNAFLDISRLDAGSIEASPSDFPVADLFMQVEAANQPLAEAKGLSLQVESSDFSIHSDFTLLQRILDNFVSNAIKHTEAGEVILSCHRDNGNLKIDVADNGSGIPADKQEKIFDEYVQLDNPGRNRSKGLGLGLAIVKHIANLLKHSISVTSTLGEGSTFSVTVPLTDKQEASKTFSTKRQSHLDNKLIKVLIADDDPLILEATTMLLEDHQFQVFSALDTDGAIDLVNNGLQPDIIISDFHLSGKDGTYLVKNIRTLTKQNIAAIIVTGDIGIKQRCEKELDNIQVLQKPINPHQLIELVHQLLN